MTLIKRIDSSPYKYTGMHDLSGSLKVIDVNLTQVNATKILPKMRFIIHFAKKMSPPQTLSDT